MMANELDRERFFQDWFVEWTSDPPVYGWASELLSDWIEYQPAIAWQLILGLVERAPLDDVLGWIGAGPLEDLLSKQGPAYIDRVEELARSNVRFLRCLGTVGGSIRMEPSVYSRLRQVAPIQRE